MWKRYDRDVENVPKKRNFSSKCKRYQIYIEIGKLKIMNKFENS
jgi:hypothetical protein